MHAVQYVHFQISAIMVHNNFKPTRADRWPWPLRAMKKEGQRDQRHCNATANELQRPGAPQRRNCLAAADETKGLQAQAHVAGFRSILGTSGDMSYIQCERNTPW
ncbi:hypothetical protein E4U43_006386 [Claviceps pusilla]|uniref:Uncharacterized protein n=1 Tax=Claviceps pusilla TaxID=123648 RepID=A0A9P7NIW6_9HYPO|nr:hypothetical protein E4U43_006386 [Claviceps pusilla]